MRYLMIAAALIAAPVSGQSYPQLVQEVSTRAIVRLDDVEAALSELDGERMTMGLGGALAATRVATYYTGIACQDRPAEEYMGLFGLSDLLDAYLQFLSTASLELGGTPATQLGGIGLDEAMANLERVLVETKFRIRSDYVKVARECG